MDSFTGVSSSNSNKIHTRGSSNNNKIFTISVFHHAFFNSIIDKHQHMHFTFNNILV